ncbi:MAG: hypothetical protein ACRCYV_10510 [Aeromonas sp.]
MKALSFLVLFFISGCSVINHDDLSVRNYLIDALIPDNRKPIETIKSYRQFFGDENDVNAACEIELIEKDKKCGPA